jgi:hypothetical protein
MLPSTAPKTRKPNGYLAAAVHGHSCPATTFAAVILNSQDRPMEAPGS